MFEKEAVEILARTIADLAQKNAVLTVMMNNSMLFAAEADVDLGLIMVKAELHMASPEGVAELKSAFNEAIADIKGPLSGDVLSMIGA